MGQLGNEEFDLVEFVATVFRRKFVFLSVFVIFVGSMAFSLRMQPKMYKTSAVIRISSVPRFLFQKHEVFIQFDPKRIKLEAIQRLQRSRSLTKALTDLGFADSGFSVDVEDIIDTDFVRLNVKGMDGKKVIPVCNALITDFLADSQKEFDGKIQMIEAQVKETEKRKQYIESLINRLNAKNVQYESSSYESIYDMLTQRLLLLQEQLLNAKDFEVFSPPSDPVSVGKAGEAMGLLFICLLGAGLSFCAVFFVEFMKRNFGGKNKS
jgi:uncharacterized protein involved in exopolysaccharide biosynthesis